MTTDYRPKIFGAGLIALDLVLSSDPERPIRAWAGGTCGNVMSILAYLGWDAYPVARMNEDAASDRVRADLEHWGVHLEWTGCVPNANTPMIVQQIRRGSDGRTDHRFSSICPHCRKWLPTFRAITAKAAERVKPALNGASVFFMDRLSRGVLTLAAEASAVGGVVVFEPSSKSSDKLMAEAFEIAHVVKYADNRLAEAPGIMENGTAVILEVQTLGEKGLKYRRRMGRSVSRWMHVKAIPAPRLIDTCGAGDWCTAGLIAKSMAGGQAGFRDAGASDIRSALRYGQSLAAWNCGFEGARGGMYAVSRSMFEKHIAGLIDGNPGGVSEMLGDSAAIQVVTCPGCP